MSEDPLTTEAKQIADELARELLTIMIERVEGYGFRQDRYSIPIMMSVAGMMTHAVQSTIRNPIMKKQMTDALIKLLTDP